MTKSLLAHLVLTLVLVCAGNGQNIVSAAEDRNKANSNTGASDQHGADPQNIFSPNIFSLINGQTTTSGGAGGGGGTTTGPASPTNTDILTSDGTANHVQDPGGATLTSGVLNLPSTSVLSFNNSVGLSLLIGKIVFGNGTAGDVSGTGWANAFIANSFNWDTSSQYTFSKNGSRIELTTAGRPLAGFGQSAGNKALITMISNGTMGFSSDSSSLDPTLIDTGFSRLSAGKVNLGNGTQGDASGTLNLARVNAGTIDTTSGGLTIATGDSFSSINFSPGGNTALTLANNGASISSPVKFSQYNSVNLVDNGLVSEPGHLDLTAQTAAISATTICTPAATGRFRISVYEKVTTPGTASTLGGATGTVLTFTDGTDSVAQSITMGLDSNGGTLAIFNSGNTTGTSLNGSAYIYALTGVPIQLAIGYTSSGTAMAFALRATCEAL